MKFSKKILSTCIISLLIGSTNISASEGKTMFEITDDLKNQRELLLLRIDVQDKLNELMESELEARELQMRLEGTLNNNLKIESEDKDNELKSELEELRNTILQLKTDNEKFMIESQMNRNNNFNVNVPLMSGGEVKSNTSNEIDEHKGFFEVTKIFGDIYDLRARMHFEDISVIVHEGYEFVGGLGKVLSIKPDHVVIDVNGDIDYLFPVPYSELKSKMQSGGILNKDNSNSMFNPLMPMIMPDGSHFSPPTVHGF